jgi:hypothetical protein
LPQFGDLGLVTLFLLLEQVLNFVVRDELSGARGARGCGGSDDARAEGDLRLPAVSKAGSHYQQRADQQVA